MRSLFYLALLVLLALFIYVQAKLAYLKINFSFRFISTSFTLQNLLELIGKGQTQTRVRIGTTVINDNWFSFIVTDFSAQLFYKQMLVAQTVETSTELKKIVVPANNKVEIVDNLTVFVNPGSVELAQQVALATKPVVDYIAKCTIFGITWTFEDNFVWE